MIGLFVIRSRQELEHVAPVVVREAREGRQARLLVLDEAVSLEDYRLRYLRGMGVACASWGEERAEELLEPVAGEAGGYVAFGWPRNGQFGLSRIRELIESARRRGIPTVGLPDEATPFANRLVRRADTPEGVSARWEPVAWTDYAVVPNDVIKDRFERLGMGGERLLRGSHERFSENWRRVLDEIAPRVENGDCDGKIKIAMFVPGMTCQVNWDEVVTVWKLLSARKDCRVAVKMPEDELGRGKLLEAYPDMAEWGNEDGAGLLRWADWVLDAGTEASFEAILSGKPCRCLSYCQANVLLACQYIPGLALSCRDELLEWSENLGGERAEYPAEAVARYVREVTGDAEVSLRGLRSGLAGARGGMDWRPEVVPERALAAGHDLILRHHHVLDLARSQRKMVDVRDNMIHTRDTMLEELNYEGYRNSIEQLARGNIRMLWHRMRMEGVERVALFGAGKHTRWLLHVVKDFGAPSVARVYDDAARPGDGIGGVPVERPERDAWKGEPILLSTDVSQEKFRERCRAVFGEGARLVDLYADMELKGPYPKTWDEHE